MHVTRYSIAIISLTNITLLVIAVNRETSVQCLWPVKKDTHK